MRLGTADVLVRAKTSAYHKKLDAAETKTKKFGKSAVASLGSITSSFASLAGVAGIGGLASAMVLSGAKFESQMATLQGVMRLTSDEYDSLAAAAKEMGATTEWTATQAAEALINMGRSGWSVQKAIAALPGMLGAATAGELGLGETSSIVTGTLNAMGLEIKDVGRLIDVMVGTTNRSSTNLSEMGEAMKEAAPYARAYGFEIEEVASLIGIVADSNIKGGDTGTGLKNTWINNARAAKILGTNATDLIGTLRATRDAQWGVNEYAAVYGKIAGKTVLNIAIAVDKYEALAGSLHNVAGETDALAAIKLDTLEGYFKLLISAMDGVGQSAFDNIKGDLRDGVKEVTEYVKNNKEVFVGFAEDIKEVAVSSGKLLRVAGDIVALYLSLPSEVKGAATYGVVGAVLFGGATGKFFGMISLINSQMSKMNAGLGDMVDQHYAAGNALVTLWNSVADAATGKTDWWTGESLVGTGENLNVVTRAINEQTEGFKRYSEAMPKAVAIQKPPAPISNSDAEKKAAEIASLYSSAYSSLDTMTQATYDAMATQYKKDYDEFVKVTGDKVTAQAVLNGKMSELNKKMLGVETDETIDEKAARRQTEAIDHQISALKLQAKTFSMSTAESEVYRLGIQGATDSQLALAKSHYDTIESMAESAAVNEEGVLLTASMRTETEKLGDERERITGLWAAEAISVETYGRAIQQVDDDLANLNDGNYWDNFLESMETNMQDLDFIAGDALNNLSSSFGTFFSDAILESESLGDAFYTLASGMASSMLSAIGQMAAEWLVYQATKSLVDKTIATSAAVSMTANAEASSLQAGVNAYSSAAAIPITGWAMAPAAMASALAVTTPMVASIAALASSAAVGMAHEGIDSVPTSGTWLLEKGERVTTGNTSQKLDTVLSDIQTQLSSNTGSAGGNTIVQSNPKIVNVWDESMISDHINSGKADSVIINRIKKNASTVKSFLN